MTVSRERQKAAAAAAAIGAVTAGMLVGLGTGTTVAYAIQALGTAVRAGLGVRVAATSLATARAATATGLTVLDFSDLATVDLCIDGVDEIDPALRAIKGGGGALLREKVVAAAATRMIAIADGSKPVVALARAVPLEILPFARASVAAHLAAIGGVVVVRHGAASDQGNLLADCRFTDMSDPDRLATALSAIPGVLGHGLFLAEIDQLVVAMDEGVLWYDRPNGTNASFAQTLR